MKVCSLCYRCHEDADVFCVEDASPLSESRPGNPDMVQGYHLEIQLSSGVAGDRYRARQTACGSPCVIALHTVTDGPLRSAFLNEAKLAESLFDPNLTAVYEAGELTSGQCFVVAEDAHEQTLREYVHANGDLRLLQAVEIVRETAEAVSAVHLKGLAHRALRPENILVSTGADGFSVRLQDVDFGDIRSHSIVSNKFLIDSAIDSLRYFAPEQCAGETAGPASDIYALGVVLYEMIAGVPPFDASTAAGVIEKHRSHRPPELRVDNFELRMLITHAVMEALHKRADGRPSSANAFARQLRHVEQLASHVSTPPPAINPRPAPRKVVPPVVIEPSAPTIMRPNEAVRIDEEARPVPKEPRALVVVPTQEDTRMDAPERTAVSVEPEPVTLADVDTGEASPEPKAAPETLGTAIANFVRQRSAPAVSHFSRLKERRKKDRPSIAPPEEFEPQSEPLQRGRVLSAEAAAAQMQAAMREVAELRAKAKPRKIVCKVSDEDIPTEKNAKATASSLYPVSEVSILQPEIPPAHPTVQVRASEVLEEPERSEAYVNREIVKPVQPVAQPEPSVVAVPKRAEPQAVLPARVEVNAGHRPRTPIFPEPISAAAELSGSKPLTVNECENAEEPKPAMTVTPAPTDPRRSVAASMQPPEAQEPKPVVRNLEPAAASRNPVPLKGPVIDLKPRGIRISGLQDSSRVKAPVALQENEEITLVSPASSRFRVQLEPPPARRPRPARRVVPIPPNEAVYVPTILGGAVSSPEPRPVYGGSILANYDPPPARRAIPYRSLTAGSGFIVIIAFFLFASNFLWKDAAIATSGDPSAAASALKREPRPSTATANTALPVPHLPNGPAEKPAPVLKSDETEEKATPAAVKMTTVTASKAAERTAETPKKPAAKTAETSARTAGKAMPAPPPIIVGQKPSPVTRPEPVKRETAPKAQPIIVRSSGATRPRIVGQQR